MEISGRLVSAGYAVGFKGNRMALFRSMDIGLLCDFAYSVAMESRSPEERDSLDRWLNETPRETAERIEREKAEERAERMRFAGRFAQVITG